MGGICALCRNVEWQAESLLGIDELIDPVHYFTVRVCHDREMIE